MGKRPQAEKYGFSQSGGAPMQEIVVFHKGEGAPGGQENICNQCEMKVFHRSHFGSRYKIGLLQPCSPYQALSLDRFLPATLSMQDAESYFLLEFLLRAARWIESRLLLSRFDAFFTKRICWDGTKRTCRHVFHKTHVPGRHKTYLPTTSKHKSTKINENLLLFPKHNYLPGRHKT